MKKHWQHCEVSELYNTPFISLIYKAQTVHKKYFNSNEIQLCKLLSIKTGRCPEDCAYCPQSARYKTNIEKEKLLEIEKVVEIAKQAKSFGATRFCMGAAWKNPSKSNLDKVKKMIIEVKKLGLETCVTLGMLDEKQACELKESGLDFYNHNIDTSRDFYKKIISTRSYDDRLETINNLRKANINVCCGGILAMGETRKDRIDFLCQLANLPKHPESVPINKLVSVKGTPLGDKNIEFDNFEFIKTIAVARVMMPKSYLRLSAGRNDMSEEMQTLCFIAGANSIFYGDKLLTTPNPSNNADFKLFEKLGINKKLLKD